MPAPSLDLQRSQGLSFPIRVISFTIALAACVARFPATADEGTKLPPGVVATVDGVPIYKADIDNRLWRESGSVDLDYAVNAQVVLAEAAKRGISVSPEEIQSRIADYKTTFITAPGHTPRDWEAFVNRYGMKQIEAQQRNDILVQRIGDDEAKKAALTPAEKGRVFADLERAAHKVHAKIVLVGIGDEFGGRTAADARTRANEAKSKVDGGAKWDDVCLEFSDDVSTRPNAGDLGFVTRDQVDKALEDALFAAQTGPASRNVVQVKNGFVVFEVLERTDNPPTEADKAKALDETLKRKREIAKQPQNWFGPTRDSYHIERLLPYRR
jgi:parvulin-like peptidyl-prolyl isomerase